MGHRAIACLLIACAAARVFAADIATNAAGGAYSADQRFWFSVPQRERLALHLDGKELYRGSGPASVLLGADPGTEHQYSLKAERRSAPPEDELLESRTYLVWIDRKAPEGPTFFPRKENDGSWTLDIRSPYRVDALYASGTDQGRRRDLRAPLPVPAEGLDVLSWTVDGAGNRSEPVPYRFRPLELTIESPQAGVWVNPQLLVVDALGGGEVYWTDDGSDPSSGAGNRYDGPVLIEKTGAVVLRVALAGPDGRSVSREVRYTVSGGPYPAELAALQSRPLVTPTAAPVPRDCPWAIDGPPRMEGGRSVVLRPIPGVRRAVSLRVALPDGVARFAYVLDGLAAPSAAPADAASAAEGGLVFSSGAEDPVGAETRPRLVSLGSLRLLVWPRDRGSVRYRLDGKDSWVDAVEPLELPVNEVRVEWIVERSSALSGPFALSLQAAEEDRIAERPQELKYRRSFSGEPWTAPRQSNFSAGPEPDLAVCDGEDLEWLLPGTGEDSGRIVRIDRAPPPVPTLKAPEEGAWAPLPGRLAASAADVDDGTKVHLRLEKTYPSGRVEETTGIGWIEPTAETEVPVRMRLEAAAEDPAGNLGPTAVREFVVDIPAVYVSDAPHPSGLPGDGSRMRPFTDLESALGFAAEKGIKVLRVAGSVPLRKRASLPAGLRVEGFYDSLWKPTAQTAELRFSAGAGLLLPSGGAELLSLRLVGTGSAEPLIDCRGGASLRIADSELLGAGILISAEGGRIRLENTLMTQRSAASLRVPSFSVKGGAVEWTAVRLEGAGNHVLGLDLQGGTFSARECIIALSAQRTGLALRGRDAELRLKDTVLTVRAGDFASALECSGGVANIQGGSLEAVGRDAVAVSLRGTSSEFRSMTLRLDSAFVAKAFEVRGIFPRIAESLLAHAGTASRSDVLSFPDGGLPASQAPGPISGNRIDGFSQLLGGDYGIDRLAAFNRDYAAPGRPNALIGGTPSR